MPEIVYFCGMKNYILPFMLLICLSCSKKDHADEPLPPRPGVEKPSTEPAKLAFVPDFLQISAQGQAKGVIEIELQRRGDYLPDTIYDIESAGVAAPADVRFAKGGTKALVPVSYDVALAQGQEHKGTVKAGDALFTLYIRYPREWSHRSYGFWDDGEIVADAVLETRGSGTLTDYRVSISGDVAAEFSVDDTGRFYPGSGGMDVEKGVIAWLGKHFIESRPGREVVAAQYRDGWLFGVIGIAGAAPADPGQNPWRNVLIKDYNKYIAVDLYDNAPGLNGLNGAAVPALLEIAVDGVVATVTPQPAPFVNTDLFPRGLNFAGEGTVTEQGIDIPVPLTDFYGSFGPWAKIYPSQWRW